ncbi:MAG TPA: xanthine dehydrogenase family protein subunit M [Candidatus Limnocylindria bacterium]|nr:xanthine dehydrogenase family protein subunit M [Candidatus Limnocylindria bacterium]
MSYEWHDAATWSEALALLERHADDATVVAGSTAFTLLYRQGLIRPGHVVALRRISDAARIDADAHGGLSIGAMATHSAVASSERVRRSWPELADAVSTVATIRVRNQATLGGSVAHADPASDAPVMLAALAAQAVVVSGSGATKRRVPVDEIFVDTFTTSLAPTELIHSIEVPARPAGARAVYRKFTLRSVDDYATVSVGALADLGGGTVNALRVFLGGVGPTPMRARSVERALIGGPADGRRFAEAAALARDEVDPIDDARGSADYKREMARVWTERALRSLVEIS